MRSLVGTWKVCPRYARTFKGAGARGESGGWWLLTAAEGSFPWHRLGLLTISRLPFCSGGGSDVCVGHYQRVLALEEPSCLPLLSGG